MNKKKKGFKQKLIGFVKLVHLPTIIAIILFYLLVNVVCFFTIRANEDPNVSFWDVFGWNTLTMTGQDYHYGDSMPTRIVGMIILLIGMFGVSAITGYISSALVAKKMDLSKGVKKVQNLKNHIIICGWKSDVKTLILDILRKNKKLKTSDIVLVNNIDEVRIETFKTDEDIKGFNYIRGDFADEQTLINANCKAASKVLILGENQESLDAELVDSRVFASALMIKNMNPKCSICAEVRTERYKNYLEAQKIDEVVYSEAFTRYILSTSTNYIGMSKVMTSLLDDGDGVAIQIKTIPESWYGKTFAELAAWYKKEKNFIAIGILENMGAERELKHQILAEAQKSTNYGEIVSNLKNVKNVETNYPHLNPEDDFILGRNMGAIILGEEI